MKNSYRYILLGILGAIFLCTTNTQAQLVINEIHADPASDITGDANGDGERDPSEDEFLELVNSGATELDISGWKVFDTNSTLLERHVFPAGTIVPAGGAIVVFGGGVPVGFFGGAIVQVASSGELGLTNSSETLIIEDEVGTEIISYSYTGEAGNDQSIVRDPDISGSDSPMVEHSTATGSGGALYSPGTLTDGSLFIPQSLLVVNEIHADPASDLTGDANGDGERDPSEDEFLELVNASNRAFDLSGWKIFDTNSSLTERHVFPEETIIPAGGAIVIFGGGEPVGLFGGAIVQTASTGELALTNSSETIIIEGPSGVSILSHDYTDAGNDQSLVRDPDMTGAFVEHSTATGASGALYSPGTMIDGTYFIPQNTLVLNEIHADPAGDITGDANGDGERSASEDEFIEIINTGNTTIDLSGWKFYDNVSSFTERHVFEDETLLTAGSAIVVFGGGSPTGVFGGAVVQLCSTGNLGLTNSGDSLVIEDASGSVVLTYAYEAEADNDQSITRDPDITGTDDPMVLHSTATGSGGALYSPGTMIDGTFFNEIEGTRVQFASPAIIVNEGDGTYDLEVSITGADATNPTSVDVVLVNGSANDLDGYTTQTVTFPAGSADNQLVTISITDDDDVEAEEELTFELQNVTGGDNAELGSTSTATFTIQDNDFATSSLVINEFMAWPAGSTGEGPEVDTNGDGVSSFEEDEFIEFVNDGTVDLDISGWQIYDTYTQLIERHVFPDGTSINPGGALIVFGGGLPVGDFGGAQVQVASSSSLGLTNTNDEILIKNNVGETVISLAYGQQTRGTSITLNPDVTGAIGPHPDLNGSGFSPGTMVDGSPFNIPTKTNIQFVAASGGIDEQGQSFTIELSIVRPSDTQATTADVVITTTGYESDIDFTTTTVTFPAGSSENQSVEVTVINDEELEGDELFEFAIQNVSGGNLATTGNPSTFAFSVLDDDVPLIFNEIHADPAGDIAGDANNDGVRDPAGDEFIEVINRSLEDVDLSGYKFYDASELRHVFPSGTYLEPGRAVVVFGGGIPTGLFGGSLFQIASEGNGVGLTNTGDDLLITDADDNIQAATRYGTLADNDQSISRSPDITGGFLLHATIEGAEGKLYSPGTKNNGNLFINIVLDVEEHEQLFSIYPNPAQERLVFHQKNNDQKYQLHVYDNAGAQLIIKELEVGIANEVNIQHLKPGIYHYKLQGQSTDDLITGKIIIQR